jgi:hypothetical protein
MDVMKIAAAYFEAWNQRDSGKIVAAFAVGGTYMDPSSGGALVGEAIGHYASGLFAAFPNLTFEVVTAGPIGENMVAAQWVMHGTNTGSMLAALRPERPLPCLEQTSSQLKVAKSVRCAATST